MIETERLILRRWRDADRDHHAAMLADPDIADWLGGVVSRADADARIDRFEAAFESRGHGRFALERCSDSRFVGYCGLMPVHDSLPVAPGVEIGWGLMRDAWGEGLVTEAARVVLDDAFARLRLAEVLAYTGTGNHRSQAVMRRLGMRPDPARDFDHPQLPDGHPLKRHLVFVATPPR